MGTVATSQDALARQNAELTASNDELRLANEALVFAAERYLALHDLAPVPLLTVDRAGKLIDVNDAAEALIGASRAQLLARELLSCLAESSRARLAPVLGTLFADGRIAGLELTMIRDAEPVEVLVNAIVLPDRGATRAVLACVDVTERKRADEARHLLAKRAEEAQRLESLGVLAGGIAHDFNNLMTVVLAGTDSVLHDLPAASPQTGPLIEIRDAARHAGDLAHQMLAYSGRVSVPARPVSIADLIRELEPLIHASARSIPVVLNLPDRLPFVSGDAPQLRQLILNLVSNAAESMTGLVGTIVVAARVEDAGGSIVIEVSDQGIGMDAETRARIFDPYFSTKFTGRGLGLAVVHGVVRGHGGRITVSSALGHGASFSIHLPAAAEMVAPATAPVAVIRPIRGTILLVDDDALVRRTLTRTLTRLGLVVIAADSGDRALAIARQRIADIDVVLTDLTMPGMDGVALARTLLTIRPELPIVLISGYGEIPAGCAHVFAGALAKPFDRVTLHAVLQPLLGVLPDDGDPDGSAPR